MTFSPSIPPLAYENPTWIVATFQAKKVGAIAIKGVVSPFTNIDVTIFELCSTESFLLAVLEATNVNTIVVHNTACEILLLYDSWVVVVFVLRN